MKKEDFYDRFTRLLKNEATNQELDNLHDALVYWIGVNYFMLDSDEAKDRVVCDKHAEGIDAVFIDSDNRTIIFIQAKVVESYENTANNFPENKVKLALEGARFLTVGDYKGKITPKLENFIDEYHALLRTGDYATKIIFIGLMQKYTDDKYIIQFKKDFPQITIDFFDFKKLQEIYETHLITTASPPDRVSMEVLTNILKKQRPSGARVFTCKAKELARIYDEHGERIFQQNVRYLLGLRSKSINRQIMETAMDDERNKDFWYFNNGVTLICKKINEPPDGKVVILEKPQIINGAQTTYALHEAYVKGKLKEDVEVLIKALQTDSKEFIENVTLYTNSQNPIRLRDLCSNDEIQKKIQKILFTSYGYFYERKRGEFDISYPTRDAKIKAFGDKYKQKLISNENVAQAFLALYLDKPAQAKSEKSRIFLKDRSGFYDEIFEELDELLPEKLLIAWGILKFIEKNKKGYGKEYKNAEEKLAEDKEKIYKYDFLFHSEYFTLNLFKDFFRDRKLDMNEKEDILKIKSMLDEDSKELAKIYGIIIDTFAEFIGKIKTETGYYHNKFFKSEKSIGLARSFFKGRFNFIEMIV